MWPSGTAPTHGWLLSPCVPAHLAHPAPGTLAGPGLVHLPGGPARTEGSHSGLSPARDAGARPDSMFVSAGAPGRRTRLLKLLAEDSTENKDKGSASLNQILLPSPVTSQLRGRTLTQRAQPRPCSPGLGVGPTAVPRSRCGPGGH